MPTPRSPKRTSSGSLLLAWTVLTVLASHAQAQVPPGSDQLVLAIAPDWESTSATLTRWERRDAELVQVGAPVQVRLGRAGLAWGRGLHPPQEGRAKREGDGRSPAGVFRLGTAFADPPAPQPSGGWPVVEVTAHDLFVEDPTHAAYNTHLRVPDARELTPWEAGQRMISGDPAHALKVLVEHNPEPVEPGAGSAIFLHTWRAGGEAVTSGCTAMDRDALDGLVRWLRPEAEPVFALLPAEAYRRTAEAWGLPVQP
ncbi:MAG: L,D-peptidoglycan transpeptidase YkuD (ErfK/YbiS/YcfS/YnhG family) [Myxococcota bacterium]|jgi:L,D-peptidoglycan transpeptidase YkuD (ErfK/YbiS/YcfS/YnhG family)